MGTPRIPVSITHQGQAGRRIALIGDFPDWQHPIEMTERESGTYAVEIDLEPGIYRYKFLMDGRRYVDVHNPEFHDSAEGFQNGLLLVGGTLPPLYFAPDRRHVMRTRDGRCFVHAEVDEGRRVPSAMWIREVDSPAGVQDGLIRVPVRLGALRGGRQQIAFEWQLPGGHADAFADPNADAEPSHARFVRAHFGFSEHSAHVFELPHARTRAGEAPTWLDGAVFYAVFIDRWRRAASSPPDPRARDRMTPSGPDVFYGGDLHGIQEDLDYIKSLGVDAIVLTPVQKSLTPHRYDAVDFMDVDAAIGGMDGLAALVQAAHARGLKVMGDLSGTHVHYAHAAFRDVMENGEDSAFRTWFRIHRFPVRPFQSPSCYDFYQNRPDLPLLDLEPGPAREHVIEAALSMVTKAGLDGLRLDALNDAPASFSAELRRRLRAVRSDFLILGEVVGDRAVRFAEEQGVDVATDFQHREAMMAFFGEGRIDAAEFWSRVSFFGHRLGPFDSSFRLLFLDNHDTERFLSVARDSARLQTALVYMLFRPEPVWITYGTELELSAGRGRVVQLDDAWHERLPLPDDFKTAVRSSAHTTQTVLSLMTRLRRDVLHGTGPVLFERADGQALTLRREGNDGVFRAEFWCQGHEAQAPAPSGLSVASATEHGQTLVLRVGCEGVCGAKITHSWAQSCP
ncbi:MAG: hypothetical protein H6729_03610 [Deltaproteobacteria bacterium]|nr:hypothetical protein [Deltaproteobacteria bacterium]